MAQKKNTDDIEDNRFLEPLNITLDKCCDVDFSGMKLQCFLCESLFSSDDVDAIINHLVQAHKLVIADFRAIPNLSKYINYWRERLKDKPLEEFCWVIKTNSNDSDISKQEFYYMMCDRLPEDKQLRFHLKESKLSEVLNQQELERKDTRFSHKCLFCKEVFSNTAGEWLIFHHLVTEHGLHLGHPDNLVYKADFIELLKEKLTELQCLSCEKIFKDRHVLKEHMRKKQHKQINPQNEVYDRFYIINYLELGKNWEDIQSEKDNDFDDNNIEDWSDWNESDDESLKTVCLFCLFSANVDDVLGHMSSKHSFVLKDIKKSLNVNYYHQIKIFNFIRRQIHAHKCSFCLKSFSSRVDVINHMDVEGHDGQIPSRELWDQPEYFFPTYENDSILCAIEDLSDEALLDSDIVVHSEDNGLADPLIRGREILQSLMD